MATRPSTKFLIPDPKVLAAAYLNAPASDEFADAPCTSEYAPDPMSDDPNIRKEAARLCRDCPVHLRLACATLARDSRATFGVWGGRDLAPRRTVYRPAVGGLVPVADQDVRG